MAEKSKPDSRFTDITVPSDSLPFNNPPVGLCARPLMKGDHERTHSIEDGALWSFVAFVFGFCGGDNEKEQFLRNEAKAFLDWDIEHSDRTRWYA